MSKPLCDPKTPKLQVESWDVINPPPMSLVHFHNSFEIYYLRESRVKYLVGDRVIPVGRGDCIVLGREVPHQTQRTGQEWYSRYVLYFDLPYLAMLPRHEVLLSLFTEKASRMPLISLSVAEQREVEGILRYLDRTMQESNSPYAECQSLSLFIRLLVVLNQAWDRSNDQAKLEPAGQGVIGEIVDYVTANYQDDIRLDDLAEMFCVSKSYICRRFRETIGMSVIAYVNRQRVIRARRLLEETSESMTSIAMQCGFNSISQFNRAFKQFTGMNPTAWRKHTESAAPPLPLSG